MTLFEDGDPERCTDQAHSHAQAKDKAKADDLHMSSCDDRCSEDQLEAWLLQPFHRHRIFQELALAASKSLFPPHRDRICPPSLTFAVKLVNGDLTPTQVPSCQQRLSWSSLPRVISTSLYWSKCPRTRPESVSLVERSHPQNPNLVIFQGRKCWFEAVHAMIPERVHARKMDTLIRIRKAGLPCCI